MDTKMDCDIVLVAAGMLHAKKRHSGFSLRSRYVNYGLISLASKLQSGGMRPIVFHGLFESPLDTVTEIEANVDLRRLCNTPLFVSVPSYYALGWADLFCKIFKDRHPSVPIVVGGRWVVDLEKDKMPELIPCADLFVYGCSDSRVLDVVRVDRWASIKNTSRTGFLGIDDSFLESSPIDYSLVYGYQNFQPCVEVSRGCGRGCSFCLEGGKTLSKMKPPQQVFSELIGLKKLYGERVISPYFQSSRFAPSLEWAREFLKIYKQNKCDIQWRCEARVDDISEEKMKILSDAGLKVVDFGLESASPRQILNMGKSTNPMHYLDMAGRILKSCKESGVWAKMNIMLYLGETMGSIAETIDWLEGFSSCIKGVSAYPMLLFGYFSDLDLARLEFERFGASIHSRECYGVSNINLSSELSWDLAVSECVMICKKFMTSLDYYDLKKFSYFPLDYGLDQFKSDALGVGTETLPFRV